MIERYELSAARIPLHLTLNTSKKKFYKYRGIDL